MDKKTIVEIQSHLEMVGFIKSNGTQCRFVSMISETLVTNIRAACPFKGVIKTSKKMGLVNKDYVASVERRIAERLGVPASAVDYVPGEVWYKHLTTTDGKALPLVVNKTKDDGEYYLQYFPTESKSVYRMPNGEPVLESDLEPWFYKREKADFKPIVISVKVSNIKRLAASGVIMQVEDLAEAESALASF